MVFCTKLFIYIFWSQNLTKFSKKSKNNFRTKFENLKKKLTNILESSRPEYLVENDGIHEEFKTCEAVILTPINNNGAFYSPDGTEEPSHAVLPSIGSFFNLLHDDNYTSYDSFANHYVDTGMPWLLAHKVAKLKP